MPQIGFNIIIPNTIENWNRTPDFMLLFKIFISTYIYFLRTKN